MGKYILGLLVVCLVGVLVYREKFLTASSPRDAIEEAVATASQTKKLTSEQESVLRVQIALLDYMSKNGAPPNKLEELTPTYFDRIPKNPATGKEFEYSRDGRGYHLGGSAEVERSAAAPGSGGKSNSANGKSGEKGSPLPGDDSIARRVASDLSSGDFINPNTMAPDTFVYNPAGKRDPFKQFDFSARPQNPNAGTPLERYSLGQLRLTAVIIDPKTGAPTALVEDSTGKGYPIKIGAKIGDQGGSVVAIEADRLKVLENETDFTGKTTQRVTEMRIQSQQNLQLKKRK